MDTPTSPIVTIDGIVFALIDNQLQVLLIERAKAPFAGVRALPGGYGSRTETLQQSLQRVLQVKAGLQPADLTHTEQLYTFDTAAQFGPGYAVSVAYLSLCRDAALDTATTAESPAFFPVNHLPELAYEHAGLIRTAHERLRHKITYTNAVFALLPPQFTLTQLQAAYEAILGRTLDKRNFRKKFLVLDLIEATQQYSQQGAHRPAQLYRFKHQRLEALSRSFD